MLFFRRVMRKLGGKRLWFPQLITLGKPADTEELAGRLSAMSTVSKGDVFAVLSDLPDVMADILTLTGWDRSTWPAPRAATAWRPRRK